MTNPEDHEAAAEAGPEAARPSSDLKTSRWYVRSIQALHGNRPFLMPLIAGLFLLEVEDVLPVQWQAASIATQWLGQCLLVSAAARRLHAAR